MSNGVFLYVLLVLAQAFCVLLWHLISALALAIALADSGSCRPGYLTRKYRGDMSEHLDNPAGRLFLFLTTLKSQQQNASLQNVWSEVLGTTEYSDLLRRATRVIRLPAEIRSEVGHLPDLVQKTALRHLSTVEAVLGNLFAQNLEWAKTQLTETVMYGLETASAALSTTRPQAILEDEQLERFRQDLEELQRELEGSDLPGTIRDQLNVEVQGLKDSLRDFSISGAQGVTESARATLGVATTLVLRGIKSSTVTKVAVIALRVLQGADLLSGVLQLPSGFDEVFGALESGDHPAFRLPEIGPAPASK